MDNKPRKQALTDKEIRLLIFEYTRLKNGEIRYIISKKSGTSFKLNALVKPVNTP